MNRFIGLCTGAEGWPSPLGDIGYEVQLIEGTITTNSARKVVPDLIAYSQSLAHTILAECKSGSFLDPAQDRKYGEVKAANVANVATVADEDRLTHIVSYVAGSAQNSCSPRFLNWPAPRGARLRKRLAFLGRCWIGIARYSNGAPGSRRIRLQKIECGSRRAAARIVVLSRWSGLNSNITTKILPVVVAEQILSFTGKRGTIHVRKINEYEYEAMSVSKDGEWHRIAFIVGQWLCGCKGFAHTCRACKHIAAMKKLYSPATPPMRAPRARWRVSRRRRRIIGMPSIRCCFCRSTNFRPSFVRHNKYRNVQVYRCLAESCKRRFTPEDGFKGRT